MKPAKPLRILVADDHDIVRVGLRSLLEAEPGWQVVAEAANGREAVLAAEKTKPDIVVLDITMPEMNGLEATRAILESNPRVEVLILTMHDSEQVVREVVSAGAQGYVLKSDAGRDLVAAIQALRLHRPYFTSRPTQAVLDAYRRASNGDSRPADSPLTGREREVVQLLAEGQSNKEIAASLNISVKTVEAHRTNVMRKLQLDSLADLVRYAVRNHIVAP
jgi:DNA-binding NarL/FixJ family response regulator